MKVHTNFIVCMDKNEVTALTLLDMSATLDTIDHISLTIYSKIGMIYLDRSKIDFLSI